MLRFTLKRLQYGIARFSSEPEFRVPTLEVPVPVFPLTRHIIQLSERKFQELAK
jgi:hypothetical protein